MYPYPPLTDAVPSITYLGKLITDPSSWEMAPGAQHLWTAQGYLQSVAIGGAQTLNSDEPVTAEDLADHCRALAISADGGAVTLVAGRSGILLKLVSVLLAKAIESGLAQDLIKKAIDQFIGGLTAKPAV